jgi:RNA polymerase sigma-70 factor (ECF subfamily)
VALSRRRARASRLERPLEDLLPRFQASGERVLQAPWDARADAILQRQESRTFVREAIEQLPEEYRNVLLLRDIEEFDTSETARMLQISEANTKTRLHRARLALRTLLDPLFSGGRTMPE